jgi:threonine dehydrogenase-like Zn-dependent dehydrogenase
VKAFVVTGVRQSAVMDVEAPTAGPGEAVVDVARVGLCGTDVEFFTGEMEYLRQGKVEYPIHLGHEWSGTVASVGAGVDASLIGKRVTGDTMLGCGLCERCLAGHHWVCEERIEVGIQGGVPGALGEQLAVPQTSLKLLPDAVDDAAGALVEPGGNALRAVRAAAVSPAERLLVLGAGTIGLLAALFARSQGAEVHVMGRSQRSIDFARNLGLDGVWSKDELPNLAWHGVVDASNAPKLPALALRLVEPGRRVVYIGLAGSPSRIDTRTMALKDVTTVGILGASDGLAGAIESYATGAVDPRPLIGATVGLGQAAEVLAGWKPTQGGGPKIIVDPHS